MSSNFYPEPPARHAGAVPGGPLQTSASTIERRSATEEAMPAADGEVRDMLQRRRKSLTIDLPASLYQRFKLACMDRTMAEVLALVERRTAELEAGKGPL
jgi:hypothetical protein